MKFVTQSYYEILNVTPEASSEEVKRAYRVMRRSFRPDSMAVHSLYSSEETEAISAKIDEAFQILSNAESASTYAKYARSGRAGMAIPRDPSVFFDRVHNLDPTNPIEALMKTPTASASEPTGGVDLQATTQGESIERGLRTAPTERSPQPGLFDVPAVAKATKGTVNTMSTRPHPLPTARVSGARSVLASRNVSTAAAAAASIDPRGDHSARWVHETVRTRAVGPLQIKMLTSEELQDLATECGGVGGMFLQQVRRRQGVSLQDIADRTKIGLTMLKYIEGDETARLPAKVYLKGYLTQICHLLRLPVPQIPARYLKHHKIR